MERPNIIFIVADDLGFADLGCYGGRDAEFGRVSPVIDQVAADGLKLTQGYSNAPVCSPTRFALVTSRCGTTSSSCRSAIASAARSTRG